MRTRRTKGYWPEDETGEKYEHLGMDLDNSACGLAFMAADLSPLEQNINKAIGGWGEISLADLRLGRRVARDRKNLFWLEEYSAMIAWGLWQNLPVAHRAEWIAHFLNRTVYQVKSLLGLHTRLVKEEGYLDYHWDIYWAIQEFCSHYYRYDHAYIWRDKPLPENTKDRPDSQS